MEVKQCFGSSNEFIRSLFKKYNAKVLDCEKDLFDESLQEAKHLASCAYEDDTKWGNEASVGFRYFSVTEDFYTSIHTHCKHWISVYHMPSRPAFLGSCITNLNDALIQSTRWSAGLMEVGLSRFSPLFMDQQECLFFRVIVMHGWLCFLPLSFLYGF
ncbi:putative cellulose synthase (UDP-forming) [Helianthus annuus]|nr:putative cellulose synthase (UDP-forming) [Helianthus annuus]KAJ0937986.1 putative cellulose synthase (UDP-forming) [Helianthus annuus]